MKLTTITPYWGRPEMLRGWLNAIKAASIPDVQHLIFFVGELPPMTWDVGAYPVLAMTWNKTKELSIGHLHNIGAKISQSEWIMKLDVDCIMHSNLFRELLPMLETAQPRQWFNVGMFHATKAYTEDFLQDGIIPPFSDEGSNEVFALNVRCSNPHAPVGTNFVCRREDYLSFGGCSERFQGWGWEDYQQIYALERLQLGMDPLPGPVTLNSVTARCRDEISRPKALSLWRRNKWLALVHRYHPPSVGTEYKAHSEANRKVLLDYILEDRKKGN